MIAASARSNETPALIGKSVPQVPEVQGGVALTWADPRFLTAATQIRFSGEQFDDDLNTPVALAELQGLARSVNTHKAAGDRAAAGAAAGELVALGGRLGILALAPTEFLRKAPNLPGPRADTTGVDVAERNAGVLVQQALTDPEIESLIDQRSAARAAKNFAESDRIRDLLAAQGIVLEDRAGGQRTLWRPGR